QSPGRHARSWGRCRCDGPGSRHGIDRRPVTVSVTEPQHAVRRMAASRRSVDDDRRRQVRARRSPMKPAWLMLRDGRRFRGRSLGAVGEASGEVIFNTAMQGYQEILTDPADRRPIVAMTYPMIGNYGVNEEDVESRRPWVNGFIVKEASSIASNFRADAGLDDYLRRHGIVGIQDIDTRALTRHLRDHGAQDGILSSVATDPSRLVERAQGRPG